MRQSLLEAEVVRKSSSDRIMPQFLYTLLLEKERAHYYSASSPFVFSPHKGALLLLK